MSDENNKKSGGKGKFFAGAALGAIAGAIAGHFISKKMRGDNCGCDHDGPCDDSCPCDEDCQCKANKTDGGADGYSDKKTTTEAPARETKDETKE